MLSSVKHSTDNAQYPDKTGISISSEPPVPIHFVNMYCFTFCVYVNIHVFVKYNMFKVTGHTITT